MSATDLSAAARRVAEHLRDDSRPHHDDLRALLPLLDAAGAEPSARTAHMVLALVNEIRRQEAAGNAIDSLRHAEGWLEIDGALKLDELARAALDVAVRRLAGMP